MAKCKSCGAPIKWVKMASGNNMPVNDGSIWVKPGGKKTVTIVSLSGEVVIGDPSMRGTPEAIEGNVSHFSNCPHANQHRR
jgi:hypothetical protein